MNSHEFARILRLLSDTLLSLPDGKLDKSLAKIIGLAGKALINDGRVEQTQYGGNITQNNPPSSAHLIGLDELRSSLDKLKLEEVKNILQTHPGLTKTADLARFAKDMNLTVSTHSNRSSLIHMIMKHIERSRLDQTIRNRATPQESDKEPTSQEPENS
ncbi:MAG: hypothetical protein V1806_07500 [Pseudomonadota bacterium]